MITIPESSIQVTNGRAVKGLSISLAFRIQDRGDKVTPILILGQYMGKSPISGYVQLEHFRFSRIERFDVNSIELSERIIDDRYNEDLLGLFLEVGLPTILLGLTITLKPGHTNTEIGEIELCLAGNGGNAFTLRPVESSGRKYRTRPLHTNDVKRLFTSW